jgi:processive 1,2-diacylglycerol beta-glucosyltransferase
MENKKPRILIVTAPVGNGHNAASNAVKLCLENDQGAEVKIYDIFLTSSRFRTWWFSKFYFWQARYLTGMLNRQYRSLKRHSMAATQPAAPPSIFAGGRVKPMLENIINQFKPDAVLCAHIAGAIAASQLKQEGKFDAPVFNLVTDYDIPPFIECWGSVDYFITPSADFDQELLHYGIKPEQILPYGIPTDPKFSTVLDQAAIRRELGIREDLFTVTITNGYVGLGNTVRLIRELLETLPGKVQIISVCGKNMKLKKQIDDLVRQGQKNLLNYGFIDHIDRIMSASDLLIGKLGGLTTTEALNKGLCILAVTKLPMQEYDNMLYLSARGVCGYIKNPAAASSMVRDYVEKPEILADMRKNIEKIRKPNAAADIARALMQSI